MRQPSHRAAPGAALALAAALLAAGGCVYRVDVQQGNFLYSDAVDQVQPGMTRSQVRFLLGTPMVADSFDQSRWDYVYYYKNGKTKKVFQQHLIVRFDGDKVSALERSGEPMFPSPGAAAPGATAPKNPAVPPETPATAPAGAPTPAVPSTTPPGKRSG
jgi:outer membrane protein assembly factor BamE